MPESTDRIETVVNFAAYPSGYGWIFSARTASNANQFDAAAHQNKNLYAYRGITGGAAGIFPVATDCTLALDAAVPSFTVNGADKTPSAMTDTAAFSPQKLRLFDCWPSGGHPATSCTMRRLRVYGQDGTLKADFAPVKRLSDNAAGLCDMVRGGFFTLSTGSLEAGAAVGAASALTAPGGTCKATVRASGGSSTFVDAGDNSTSVANLFSDNFAYAQSSSTEHDHCLYVRSVSLLPLRIDYDFGEGKAANAYSIWCGHKDRAPKAWALYGSNDSTAYGAASEDGWTLLDSQSGQPVSSAHGECRTKTFANTAEYRFYRLAVTEGNGSAFDLTQLEYYSVPATARPGELHIVPNGDSTNATVRLGGDLRLVKEGAGTFTAAKSGQAYSGGTEISAGTLAAAAEGALGLGGVAVADGATLRIAEPLALSGALDVETGGALGFFFAAADSEPVLTLSGGATLPATLGVGITRGGDFVLPREGVRVTSGFDFSGTAIGFERSAWARRIETDASGNLLVYGPAGMTILFN